SYIVFFFIFFFFSSRRRHTRFDCDWSSDVCSSDLSDQHDGASDGEHESQDRSGGRRTRSTSKEAKLVPVKGTGLSGPFVQRPVRSEERRVGKECRCRWAG